jgi:hypothetical protein
MDRLYQGQQLNVNDQLVSNNQALKLIMQGDGNLVLYRNADGRPLWASNTWGKPVNRAVMQGDGNFVAYSGAGTPYWASGTHGHPGSWVVVQDDGNLVVYDGAHVPLWASNTVTGIAPPVIQYSDARGYMYNECADWWKQMCTVFPCFLALQWPGYSTTIVEDKINNQPVVIQLWKGWCPKFLGSNLFPGGIGAEVGIYKRIPGRVRPSALPFLPPALATLILSTIGRISDNDLWWPYTDLGTTIEFKFVNPITNQVVFPAGPQTTWWVTKWMLDGSHSKYQHDQRRWSWLPLWWPGNSRTPTWPNDYKLDYSINGKSYTRW